MRISEEGLRRRIGSDKLIGCACIFGWESEETAKADLDTSYTQPVDDGRPTTERKRKSDLHGTHQRRELSTHERVTDEPHPSSSYSSDSDREVPQAEERKSFTDRLKKKWNELKNAPIQKPHTLIYALLSNVI